MTKGKIAILIVGAIIIVLLIYALIFIPAGETEPISEVEDTATTTEETTDVEIVDIGGGAQIEVPEGLEITPLETPEVPVVTLPELNRPVTIPDFYPTDAAQLMATKIAEAIAEVEEDNTSFDAWLRLANLRNQIEDFDGAIEIYEYLNIVVPENDISFLNLGSLQHLRLKEFENAETNLTQAKVNNITNPLPYINLHELYRDSYKTETTLAEDILLEGIEMISDDTNLLLALGDYYKREDRIAEAIETYEEVLEVAQNTANTPLKTRMESEIAELQGN